MSCVKHMTMSNPEIKPFNGILYNKEKIGGIERVVCPPYDVISDVQEYYRKSELNAIRLELPVAHEGSDQYTSAMLTMQRWMTEKVLLQDPESIYVYEQEFHFLGRSLMRRGFVALHRLDRKKILTHEETRKKAKADRERLIGTLRTFTSFIFGLYEDQDLCIEEILSGSTKELIYDFSDEQSVHNRFYRISDNDTIGRLASLMSSKKIYVADGHHRLDVSYRLGLMYAPLYVTNLYSPGITIMPYHRIAKFGNNRPLPGLLDSLRKYANVEQRPYSDELINGALQEIKDSSIPAFVLYSKDDPDSFYVAYQKFLPPLYDETNLHASLKKLKVSIVHSAMINEAMQIRDEEISFTQDHAEAVSLVSRKQADLAVLLPPTTVEEVKDIADNGLYMPAKSTFFYPKILTGLVFYTYG